MYQDVSTFLDLFDDLNESVDWKKNEYILKHFFQSSDPKRRRPIEVDINPENITRNDVGHGPDIAKV